VRPIQKISKFSAVTVLIGTALLGCSRVEKTTPEERYAHRYLPQHTEWQFESEIPKEPQESPGMIIWEVSRFAPKTLPTREQLQAAKNLVEQCYDAAREHGWYDFEKGLADGYHLLHDDVYHFTNDEYMLDDVTLDPHRPENLMYYETRAGERVLAGFMFNAKTRTAWGPQIGGPVTVWHYHVWKNAQCVIQNMLGVAWSMDGVCEKGTQMHRSSEMMHVWLVDHPEGPFATTMRIGKEALVKGIEKRLQKRGF
jgi:hypothetical protein